LYYITFTNWTTFLNSLLRLHTVYGLVNDNANLFWKKLAVDDIAKITINRYRAVYPVKSFFFPVKEEVTHEPSSRMNVLIGVKACDLAHLLITDPVFSSGVVEDPYYRKKRDNTIIISADCNDHRSSCFCTMMGGSPYAQRGFEINLSPTRSGFIAEIGSERGAALVSAHKKLFQEPRPEHLEERRQAREQIARRVQDNNSAFNWKDPREIVTKGYASKAWEQDIAATCVECDGCRFTCGTCYCFLLGETAQAWGKMRTWDSCQSAGYGRVGGGANPRKTRAERLRNLYNCKLNYRPENFGVYGCSGCGRCIDVCQGKIDMRKSLQKLLDEQTAAAQTEPPHV
jgi:ferredoxin